MRSACRFSAGVAAALSIAMLGVIPDGAGAAPAADSVHTQWYVIGTAHLATYSDGKLGPGTNCPRGGNGKWLQERISLLQFRYHYTAAQAKKALASKEGSDLVMNRGLKDGKPASIHWYPLSIPHHPRELVAPGGKGYGFNLDGKGSSSPNSLVDPDTHARDVQNNLFRVLGCHDAFNVNPPTIYGALSEAPAWLISVTGADLGKDGPVTIGFAKALEHALGANGKPLQGQMYTLDPSSRSFGSLQGRLVGGELIASGGQISLEGERVDVDRFIAALDLTHTHLHLKRNPDGNWDGYLGGFQPWMDYWYMLASGQESCAGADISSVYYELRALADSDPDPATGANRRISATYRLVNMVPVYVSPAPEYRPPVKRRALHPRVVARTASGRSSQ